MSRGLPSASGALNHRFQRQKEGERVESSTLSKKRSVVERNSKKEEALFGEQQMPPRDM